MIPKKLKRQAVHGYASSDTLGRPDQGWRLRLYTIIFEADTLAGRRFDQLLFLFIGLSLVVIMADSIDPWSDQYRTVFLSVEWGFTLLFTIEYVLRLLCVKHPWRYATSFYGVVDLLAVLPAYAAFFFPDLAFLIGVRTFRLLRVFRVFKMTRFVSEYQMLARALRASGRKILVFLSAVLLIVLVMGTIMYVVEGPGNGFSNIPVSVYWAITTLSTVGFGDIVPQTGLGKLIASLMMLLGWGVLAVPTGIVTMEMTVAQRVMAKQITTRTCQECLTEGHEVDAKYCKECGAKLPDYQSDPELDDSIKEPGDSLSTS